MASELAARAAAGRGSGDGVRVTENGATEKRAKQMLAADEDGGDARTPPAAAATSGGGLQGGQQRQRAGVGAAAAAHGRSPPRLFPAMFERSSLGPLDPRFDSEELESQLSASFFPQTRRKFRYAVCYVMVSCVLWAIDFAVYRGGSSWLAHLIGTVLLALVSAAFFGLTWSPLYRRRYYAMSALYALLLCSMSLLGFAGVLLPSAGPPLVGGGGDTRLSADMTAVGSFTGSIEILLMIYTLIPFPMYLAVTIALVYTCAYEVLLSCTDAYDAGTGGGGGDQGLHVEVSRTRLIAARVLLHASVHVMGAYIYLMTSVQRHSTFWQVGQSSMARAELNHEKEAKEKMIHSLMPPMVANAVMKQKENDRDDEKEEEDGGGRRHGGGDGSSSDEDDMDDEQRERRAGQLQQQPQRQSSFMFRQFTMYLMDNVSILYADIVGFTKMSSNKTAEHLVLLLNDLFGRFDHLCAINGCEKISTLGDCYYCVSGCPNPRSDHARCCVEMGLDMITAIKEFDEANNEEVNMRVGIHTGKVLCGIVGTRRFKFDVWSHDVELANNMESTGMPGKVHVSECTYAFLNKDEYIVEPGEEVEDTRKKKKLVENYDPQTMKYRFEHVEEAKSIKTYFIDGRRKPNRTAGQAACGEPASASAGSSDGAVCPNNNVSVYSTSSGAAAGTDESSTRAGKDGYGKSLEGETIELVEAHEKRHSINSVCPLPVSRASVGDKVASRPSVRPQESDTSKLMASAFFSRSKTDSEPSLENGGTEDLEGDHPRLKGKSAWRKNASAKKRDINLVKFIQADKDNSLYFYQPPVHHVTLNFTDAAIEQKYRLRYHRDVIAAKPRAMHSWSAPRLYALLDLVVAALNVALLTAALAIVYSGDSVNVALLPLWIIYPAAVLTILSVAALVMGCDTFIVRKNRGGSGGSCRQRRACRPVLQGTAQWPVLQATGAVLILLPAGLVFVASMSLPAGMTHGYFFFFALVTALVQFSNCSLLSNWLKSCLVSAAAAVGVTLGTLRLFATSDGSEWPPFPSATAPQSWEAMQQQQRTDSSLKWAPAGQRLASSVATAAAAAASASSGATALDAGGLGSSSSALQASAATLTSSAAAGSINATAVNATIAATASSGVIALPASITFELIVSNLLVVVFLWLLNRELETLGRLAYYGFLKAQTDCRKMRVEKEHAEWLLHNIIPRHVTAELVRCGRGQFSRSHQSAGVVFASIVNFDEMYDESYEGGKEYLRVLNELFNDYEVLFDQPKFKDVEKIKTIGSTFMAASGLNPVLLQQNADPKAHLYALMDFCLELLQVVHTFNEGMFNFSFVLKIGYNVGEVVSGVIGTTKLHYDIWGNTVNVASRMYSTGMPGRIQVPEETMLLLQDVYDFEYRGEIEVKGKGKMRTWLVVGKKGAPRPPPPPPSAVAACSSRSGGH